MKHARIPLGGAVAILSALVLTACGSGAAQDRAVPADASQCTTPGAASTDPSVANGSVDVAPPGSRTTVVQGDFAAQNSVQFLSAFPAIGVVEVVARDKPVALASSQYFAVATERALAQPRANLAVQEYFAVVRPAAFQVVETVRGTLPECLDLAVPGGSVGDFTERNGAFPARFAVGDRLLALFEQARPPRVSFLFPARQDGNFLLPFGEKVVNAATWEPPAYKPPGPLPPGGLSPRQTTP